MWVQLHLVEGEFLIYSKSVIWTCCSSGFPHFFFFLSRLDMFSTPLFFCIWSVCVVCLCEWVCVFFFFTIHAFRNTLCITLRLYLLSPCTIWIANFGNKLVKRHLPCFAFTSESGTRIAKKIEFCRYFRFVCHAYAFNVIGQIYMQH